MILAVDPGRITGWALFLPGGRLVSIGVVRKPELVPSGPCTLVIEKPHGGRGKASRTDLVTLARRMQTVITTVGAAKVVEVLPSRWKGSTRKAIMTRRIRDLWMDDADRTVFEAARIPPSYAHNALDAYGLGRYYLATQGIREIPCR